MTPLTAWEQRLIDQAEWHRDDVLPDDEADERAEREIGVGR